MAEDARNRPPVKKPVTSREFTGVSLSQRESPQAGTVIGGASAAEVAALEVFRTDPEVRAVRAATVEIYGEATIPPHAIVQFSGHDEHTGPITKYTLVEPYGNAS